MGFISKKNESQHYRNFPQAFGTNMCLISYLKNKLKIKHVLGTWGVVWWPALHQGVTQWSAPLNTWVKNLSALLFSRQIGWKFWRKCTNKKNQLSGTILHKSLLGFMQEFIHTRVSALGRISGKYELVITKGRSFLLWVCSWSAFIWHLLSTCSEWISSCSL